MRRLLLTTLTIGALLLAAGPAAAAPDQADSPGDMRQAWSDAGVVDVVLAVSGDSGFDRRGWDFDLLREALVATDLVGAVAGADDITVFAPNDRAFRRLASELGWDGSGGEEGAFGFLATNVGVDTISDVLLYHVGDERLRFGDLIRRTSVTTLLGPDVEVSFFRVRDADTDDRDPRVTFPWYVPTDNGSIVVIDRVLRPIDLP